MPQNLVTFHRCHIHTNNIFNFQCIVWTVIMFYKRHSWSQLPDSIIGSVRDMRMSHTSKIQSAFEQFPCEHNTSLGSMDYLLSRGSTVQLYIWTVLNIDYRSRDEGMGSVFPPYFQSSLLTSFWLIERESECGLNGTKKLEIWVLILCVWCLCLKDSLPLINFLHWI